MLESDFNPDQVTDPHSLGPVEFANLIGILLAHRESPDGLSKVTTHELPNSKISAFVLLYRVTFRYF